jgi:hypothetical protein
MPWQESFNELADSERRLKEELENLRSTLQENPAAPRGRSLRVGFISAVGVLLVVILLFVTLSFSNRAQQIQAAQLHRDAVISDCQQQNNRHDKTINFFQSYVKTYEKLNPSTTPLARRKLESSIQGNIALINDLAPKQNCKLLAEKLYPTKAISLFSFSQL